MTKKHSVMINMVSIFFHNLSYFDVHHNNGLPINIFSLDRVILCCDPSTTFRDKKPD